MNRRKLQEFNSEAMDSVLSPDSHFDGHLSFSGSLLILGRMTGEIDAEDGHLYIGAQANVHARIRCGNVYCRGHIEGDVEALGVLEIIGSGRIDGDVISSNLQIEKGASLNGNCALRVDQSSER